MLKKPEESKTVNGGDDMAETTNNETQLPQENFQPAYVMMQNQCITNPISDDVSTEYFDLHSLLKNLPAMNENKVDLMLPVQNIEPNAQKLLNEIHFKSSKQKDESNDPNPSIKQIKQFDFFEVEAKNLMKNANIQQKLQSKTNNQNSSLFLNNRSSFDMGLEIKPVKQDKCPLPDKRAYFNKFSKYIPRSIPSNAFSNELAQN